MHEEASALDHFLKTHAGLLVPHPLECLNISVSTVCSLACCFCAYPHSRIPREGMRDDIFRAVIEGAVEFGYRVFNLTPIVGEVLMDPGFVDKLQYLDRHPGVKFYFFSSNLTHADQTFFCALSKLKKLRWFSVSLYGLNPEDYQTITGAPADMFARVLRNLKLLLRENAFAGRCEIKVRGPGSQKSRPAWPECTDILERLKAQGIQIRHGVRIMNWGGLIKKNEMCALDLDYKDLNRQHELPCIFLFHKPSVLPDGTLNACSCGDAHAQLAIGNVREQRFCEVFSSTNAAYTRILHRQIAGRPPAPCRGCTGYRPLDRHWYSYDYYDRDFIALGAFFDWLRDPAPVADRQPPPQGLQEASGRS